MTTMLSTVRALVREEQHRLHFPMLGLVTDVKSRTSDGGKENHQVGVHIPALDVGLLWAPVAVGRLGLSALPRVDDLVVVVFVGGDVNAPIVLGSLYDHNQHPPTAKAAEVVYKVPAGDASDVRRLHLELPSGATVTFEDDLLSVVYGSTTLELNRDGDLNIASGSNVSITASGDLTLEAQGNVSIKAQQSMELGALSVTVEGQASTSIKGGQISLAGMTQFSPA